jgi:hypothetical protein
MTIGYLSQGRYKAIPGGPEPFFVMEMHALAPTRLYKGAAPKSGQPLIEVN